MQPNQQPMEKRIQHIDSGVRKLDVHSIFYTIQGEGPFTGTPAVFIRLAGCNLQCPGCDTDYTRGRRFMSVANIRDAMDEAYGSVTGQTEAVYGGLVVITGGEPFRQDLSELCEFLLMIGCYVQIETNGTLPPTVHNKFLTPSVSEHRKGVYIVCSPKTGRVHPDTHRWACCYKYVMSADSVDPDDGLPTHVLSNELSSLRVARPTSTRPIYLQPMDEQNLFLNSRHLQACVNSCMKHGYTLQLQIHKILRME